ncbi:hypothetical protein [Nocardia salmonicida]|uniref:hypothetical protein n=1 Tax=Nocardia salmonicida TaxID=53431 RepID=UPI0036408B66
MAASPHAVALEIWRRYPEVSASQRWRHDQVKAEGVDGAQRDAPHNLFGGGTRGSAITTPGVEIDVVVRTFDAADLGSFPSSNSVTAVEVAVRGRATKKLDEPGLWIEIPDVEVLGWSYAVLGRDWYDHGYLLHYHGGEWDRTARVMVLLDPNGRPVDAPPDFYFAGTAVATAERVTFRPLSTTDDHRSSSDVIANSERPESLKWQVRLSGSIDSTVQAAAQALLEALRAKGTVASNFELVSLRVEGNIAVIGFKWRNANRYAEERLELPADNDFSARTEFYQRAVPRVAQARSAAEWANQVVTAYQEAFNTGFLGFEYLHPGSH